MLALSFLRRELFALLSCACIAQAAFNVTLPSHSSGTNAAIVYSTFLGISFELSFVNDYLGNTSDGVPGPMLNYIAALKARGSAQPVKLRVGGNSMDSAIYNQSLQVSVELQGSLGGTSASSDDVATAFGPVLYDVMSSISDAVGGAEYLVGVGLRDPNNTGIPLSAGDAQQMLGNSLDTLLLGNEPDLYAAHGDRPSSYTINDYIGDYWVAFENLEQTPEGDVLSLNKISGPTICCAWNLASVLNSGWLDDFSSQLKYITVQHYPQDNCGGGYPYQLDYYLTHANAVGLAQWQSSAITELAAQPAASRKPLVMSEFNTASCGGIPGISDTFGATLWTADYALQLASVGYSAVFLHTRERGVSYNIMEYPNVSGAAWTTNPPYYALLAVAEALQGANGSTVVDLDVADSKSDKSASVAGYAVYDGAATQTINAVVLFNFANASGNASVFALDQALFATGTDNVTVRYLAAPSVNERTDISWGGQTGAGVGNGTLVADASSAWPDQSMSCASGCSISVPGPGLALVVVNSATSTNTSGGSPSTGGNDGSKGGSGSSSASAASSVVPWSIGISCVLALAGLLLC